MEEYVGELWHRFITKAATRRYPEAAVALDDVARPLAIYFRALGGDPGLAVSGARAEKHGGRRRWLEKVAGTNQKFEYAWRDEETLRLPERIDLFESAALNRDLYYWLAALNAVAIDADRPWIVRNQQATLHTLSRFPGLKPRYLVLVEAVIAQRLMPPSMRSDERAQELAIRQALLQPGSVNALPSSSRPLQPVPLWPHPAPPQRVVALPPKGDGAPESGSGAAQQKRRRKHAAERRGVEERNDGMLMMFRAESLFSWAEFVNVNRPQDDEDDQDAGERAAEDMEKLTMARDGKTSAARVRFDLDLPAAVEDDAVLATGILLPEWHWKKRQLLPGHVSLSEMSVDENPGYVMPPALRRTAGRLRRQFQALVPQRQWLKGQPDGEEIDLDAWGQLLADRAGGVASADHGLYRAQVNQQRDLACLLLADLSLSTDAYVSDHARTIDVIRDSLMLFAEALDGCGDRFALCGFSSLRRGQVRFHRLKDFDERYDAGIRGRIAGIRPGYYTRMGAAIRHATTLLSRQKHSQRLLLLLTDGKPNNIDHYEGRYAIEDTRAALHEAKQAGLRPFCVTIDSEANDYLPHLFGSGGYVVIRKPDDLPRELPLLYAQMTR